jgi:hypothetical protein
MPIIKAIEKSEKIQIRISMESDTLEAIKAYCEWAGIKKQDDFFEQAVKYVLSKDNEWKNHCHPKKVSEVS